MNSSANSEKAPKRKYQSSDAEPFVQELTASLQKASLNSKDTESETISPLDFRALQIRGRERKAQKVSKKIRRKRRTGHRVNMSNLETVPEVDESQQEIEDEGLLTTPQCCSINKFLYIAFSVGSILLFIFFMIVYHYK